MNSSLNTVSRLLTAWFLVALLNFAMPAAFAGPQPVYLTDARIELLKKRVAAQVEPTYSAWLVVKKGADDALVAGDPVVPETFFTLSPYRDLHKHNEVQASTTYARDCHAVFRLALAWRITGEEKYAHGAVKLLNVWATRLKRIEAKEENTSLTISSGMPDFIIAADLLKNSPAFTPADQKRFTDFLKHVVLGSDSAGLCMKRSNNWANFGTLLAMTAGIYLDDRSLFNRGVSRWKQLVNSQMAADGTLKEEVSRYGKTEQGRTTGAMGLWYSNFSLFPATIAAEVARVNGVDLYDYVSPSGKSLRLAYEKLIPWIKDPTTFFYYKGKDDPHNLTGRYLIPYFEMLTQHWPNPDALAMLQAHRPVKTNHCVPDETFTHGDLPGE